MKGPVVWGFRKRGEWDTGRSAEIHSVLKMVMEIVLNPRDH